jgi:hypothetical protein
LREIDNEALTYESRSMNFLPILIIDTISSMTH